MTLLWWPTARGANHGLRALAAALVATLFLAANARASAPDQRQSPGAPGGTIVAWTPEYTLSPLLPDHNAATFLVATGERLFLSSEEFVASFDDGVWSPPSRPPNVGAIFSMAAAGSELWAFGFEGGMWHSVDGSWTSPESVTGADLYAAVARAPDDVWAVGFDFDSEYGTVLNYDGSSFTATIFDWLHRQQLFALAAAPDGSLWAGGCDYSERPFLMRRRPGGPWLQVDAPVTAGCVHHLSFSVHGTGLAAAGSDVYLWDGISWLAADLAPPEGKRWVRVAATKVEDEPPTTTSQGGVEMVAGWALAAEPRWPTYVNASEPVYFDGYQWQPGNIDYLNLDRLLQPTDTNVTPRPFMALASDGVKAWAASRLSTIESMPGAESADGTAALIELTTAQGRLAHPLLAHVEDVDTVGTDEVWLGGQGAYGILRGANSWSSGGPRSAVASSRVDFAGASAGWTLGLWAGDDPSAPMDALWYWDGSSWLGRRLPAGPIIRDMRALPDGRVWGVTTSGQVFERDVDRSWSPVPWAPSVTGVADGAGPGVPYDVVSTGGRVTGWIAGREGFYRYENFVFIPSPQRGRHFVTDLQLADARHGWALAIDRDGEGFAARSRLLMRLVDRVWSPVPLGDLAARLVDWDQMSAVGPDEVWMLGTMRVERSGALRPVLARYDGAWRLFGEVDPADAVAPDVPVCSADRLAAVRRADGGTDVWLGNAVGPCGPSQIAAAVRGNSAGPVSRLRVAPVRSSVLLPLVSR